MRYIYHWSDNPNLSSPNAEVQQQAGSGITTGFFCCGSSMAAKNYGKHGYRMVRPLGADIFNDSDATGAALSAVLEKHGINYNEHADVCWDAIVVENRGDEWAELVEGINPFDDDGGWFAQQLRAEVARSLGFQAAAMEDDYYDTMIVFPEFASFEPMDICPECGNDRGDEDCDCDEE